MEDSERKAVVTGSTFYSALGLSTLKDQKEHFEKVYENIRKSPSDMVKMFMEHGTKNEINALATLVGKILPVFYPHITFQEDGCVVVPLGETKEPYSVVSGDGSGLDEEGHVHLAFEMKCPMPKSFTTDVHYALPERYGTQILSQMAAKRANTCVYISYTEASSTVIVSPFDDKVWTEVCKLTT